MYCKKRYTENLIFIFQCIFFFYWKRVKAGAELSTSIDQNMSRGTLEFLYINVLRFIWLYFFFYFGLLNRNSRQK